MAILEFVDCLTKRIDFLECLEDAPKDKRTLVDELEYSRSTVNRAIWELEDLALVTYRDGQYHLTVSGQLLLTESRRYDDRIRSIVVAQDLLNTLPPGCDCDASIVQGADCIVAPDGAPHLPGKRVAELVKEADYCRALSRAHSYAKAADVIHDQIVNEGMEAEVVVQEEVLAHLDDRAQTWIEMGRCEIFAIDSVPFGLFILSGSRGTTGCLLVYTSANDLRGALINESEAAIEWAEDTFETHKQRATAVAGELRRSATKSANRTVSKLEN